MHTNRHTPQFKSWGICKTGLEFHAQSSQTGSQGNVLISRHTIQVPLPTGFSTADALAALAKSMEEQGFMAKAGSNVVQIAGNNIDPNNVTWTNFSTPPSYSGPTAWAFLNIMT